MWATCLHGVSKRLQFVSELKAWVFQPAEVIGRFALNSSGRCTHLQLGKEINDFCKG